MREYELLVLGKGDLSESEQKSVVTDVEKMISDEKGTVSKRDDWGKRALAYEIDKQKDGYYTLFHFIAPEEFPKKLERKVSLDENIMRHLLLRED